VVTRDDEAANASTVREYLGALESGVSGQALARFFTSDARQVELPNRLNPGGGESDLATLLRRSEQGRQLLSEQRFEVTSEVAQGDRVAVEAKWTGTLAVPLGTLQSGTVMKAHFAMFFEFRDGRIRVQRNYDCFEPW
jgi:ketosteroid isomerase-like protein